MKILKFGGSSIGKPERVQAVLNIIASRAREEKLAVVVSAFGGVTNRLIEAATRAADGDAGYKKIVGDLEKQHLHVTQALLKNRPAAARRVAGKLQELRQILLGTSFIKELSPRTLDLVLSFGERLSAFIISESLKKCGVDAHYLNSSALLRTNDNFGDAVVNIDKSYRNIRKYFKQHPGLQVVTGFIASNEHGQITTLGRSGSDYTAALFGAALRAQEIEIWTDVNGVMTSDPRKVPAAFSIASMSYEEAMEMSHFGSRVIHPKAMQPALEKNIPLRIRNTFDPEFPGTLICRRPGKNPFAIRGISSIAHVALLRVQGSGMLGVTGISGRLFGALAGANISVILITQGSSEHSICFAVAPEAAARAKQIIEAEFSLEIYVHQIDTVVIEPERAVIAVVGNDMRGTPGIAAKIFRALGEQGVNVVAIAQGSSELNVSIVIDRKDDVVALNAIHGSFFGTGRTSAAVFLVGPGLVGSALLRQMHKLQKKATSADLQLQGLANSRRMVFAGQGVALTRWKTTLQKSTERMDPTRFVERVLQSRGGRRVFVDCTASEALVPFYATLLRAGVAVVTPNKRANSGTLALYRELRQAARFGGTSFRYETNVGAGLPVLSTLQDLLASGDEVLQLEAVLSGSLSYIFNSFDGRQPFSDIVRSAQKKGYTEPDPRDDLNGLDVARKLLILAREMGLACEFSDVEVENILPAACRKAASVADFFTALDKSNEHFDALRRKAEVQGKVLRYVARIEQGRLRVALHAVGQQHPFFSLKGTENMVVFTTKRYRRDPLVIKGPGAGAEVTAAGVLADVLKALG